MVSFAVGGDGGAISIFLFVEADTFVAGTVVAFSGVSGVLGRCGESEVCATVVEAVAVDVVDDSFFGCRISYIVENARISNRHDLSVHKDTGEFSVLFSDGAFCVEGVFVFIFAGSPFEFCECGVVAWVNDCEISLCEGDFSECVAEAEAAIEHDWEGEDSFDRIRYSDFEQVLCHVVSIRGSKSISNFSWRATGAAGFVLVGPRIRMELRIWTNFSGGFGCGGRCKCLFYKE